MGSAGAIGRTRLIADATSCWYDRRPVIGAKPERAEGWLGLLRDILVQVVFKQGETDMGDKGKRDKGKKEQQKKAQLSPKEKRRKKKQKTNA